MEGAIPRGELIRFALDVSFQQNPTLVCFTLLHPSQGLSEPYLGHHCL